MNLLQIDIMSVLTMYLRVFGFKRSKVSVAESLSELHEIRLYSVEFLMKIFTRNFISRYSIIETIGYSTPHDIA